MYNLSKLSERLRELMFDNGDIKSEELAEKLEVAGTTVRSWLNAAKEINVQNAIKVADYFQCSLEYLSGRSDLDETIPPRPLLPFYDNLRKIMSEIGISRYRITKDSPIKDSYFTKWRKGNIPELSTVCELADYMKVSLDYLTGRTDY